MKIKTRWIEQTQAEAKACRHQMPWERGTRRQMFIARRAARARARTQAVMLRSLAETI